MGALRNGIAVLIRLAIPLVQGCSVMCTQTRIPCSSRGKVPSSGRETQPLLDPASPTHKSALVVQSGNWYTEDEPEVALKYRRIAVKEQQGRVEPKDEIDTGPSQNLLPGMPIWRRSDPVVRKHNRSDRFGRQDEEDVDGKEGVGKVWHLRRLPGC